MKGICFTEEMFNAVVDGKKTQTRRLVKRRRGGMSAFVVKPKYEQGDVVYLKEPYLLDDKTGIYHYKYKGSDNTLKFKNKLFMPESAARCYIKITDVKRERLQDITSEDCMKEGMIEHYAEVYEMAYYQYQYNDDSKYFDSSKEAYEALIDKINGKGTWDANPEVWVYDFELCIGK